MLQHPANTAHTSSAHMLLLVPKSRLLVSKSLTPRPSTLLRPQQSHSASIVYHHELSTATLLNGDQSCLRRAVETVAEGFLHVRRVDEHDLARNEECFRVRQESPTAKNNMEPSLCCNRPCNNFMRQSRSAFPPLNSGLSDKRHTAPDHCNT